jgi:CBS domain-containing protein
MTRFPLHGRVHLAGDEKVTTAKFVRCAEDGRWAPVEACRRCSKCSSVDDAAVTCEPARKAVVSSDPDVAPITEVMDANVLCVDANATAESVRQVMEEQRAPIAIVVDQSRHAIGVCSRTDLGQQAPSRRVETFMTPFVITMLEKSTVADAIALVVERELNHVPVLSEGQVVGIVTPRAVIRWLAQSLRAARRSRARRPSTSANAANKE